MTSAPLECEGVPRDLGREQGSALASQVRAAVDDSLLRGLARRLGGEARTSRRWLRDVRRHFPHQGEWIEGLARAARVSELALVGAMRKALRSEAGGVAMALASPAGVQLARSATPGTVLRRMGPEGRFASVEIASPLLSAPWAGVNQGGLAVVAIGGVEASSSACTAPAALLARDCLERFEELESALAWCLSRPAAGAAAILLADAAGGVAAVEFGASERRVVRPEAGVLLVAGSGCDVATLRKSLEGAAPGDLEALLEALIGGEAARAACRVEVAARRLRVGRDGQPLPVGSDSEARLASPR